MVAIMVLIMVPYVVVVLVFIGSMIGGMAHWLVVSLGEEISHIVCITCSKWSIGDDMATKKKHLSLYEVGHEIDWSTWAMTPTLHWEKIFYELPCHVVQ